MTKAQRRGQCGFLPPTSIERQNCTRIVFSLHNSKLPVIAQYVFTANYAIGYSNWIVTARFKREADNPPLASDGRLMFTIGTLSTSLRNCELCAVTWNNELNQTHKGEETKIKSNSLERTHPFLCLHLFLRRQLSGSPAIYQNTYLKK